MFGCGQGVFCPHSMSPAWGLRLCWCSFLLEQLSYTELFLGVTFVHVAPHIAHFLNAGSHAVGVKNRCDSTGSGVVLRVRGMGGSIDNVQEASGKHASACKPPTCPDERMGWLAMQPLHDDHTFHRVEACTVVVRYGAANQLTGCAHGIAKLWHKLPSLVRGRRAQQSLLKACDCG